MALGHEVAVIGYAGRLPGARSPQAFWSQLHANASSVSWITPDRFPTEGFYHPAPDQAGRSYTFAAGLIDDPWGFDAAAFGMSPREAEQVDPQQRQLLEVTQEALAHAGVAPSSLAGGSAGVYVGASSVDYGARFFADPAAADVHMMTGNTLSILANRLSYHLDLHGPSFTVDTACSSSLVALCLAADAIRNGTVDTAIVGGVNLLLSPFSFVGFSRASMLSPTGRCRPFDAAADGYVRAEGAIVLVLRSTAAAREGRNRIHGTLAGWGVGQDGRTTGLSLPSAESQRRLLEEVYGTFGLDPCELAFVEAHGTGTRVGDPVEADALGRALGQQRARPLPIGSVKSNIGHLEPASGLAGVLKTLLALQNGIVPATLHQASPNPDIAFDELNLQVIKRNWRLPEQRGPALAGVNSFGFGGTNAHVVLRGEDRTVAVAHVRSALAPPPLLISAHDAEALAAVADRTVQAWPADGRLAVDYVAAAAHQRDALPHRAVIQGATTEALRQAAARFAAGEPSPAVLTGQAVGQNAPVAFVFAGNGAQWAGMGRAAWHGNARFREALQEIDALFTARQEKSLIELMFAEDLAPRLRQARQAQPLLLALQMATVRGLEALGLTPQATLGHSVGEIAAAWCAGALSTEQAIEVVIARSHHQEQVRGSGTMAALMLGEGDAQEFLQEAGTPQVDVAAINSWRSVTVSGPAEAIEQVLAAAAQRRIGARRLDLDYPFHSRLIDPVRAPLLEALAALQPRATRRTFVSAVTGTRAEGEALDAAYWWRNVRAPVRFDAAAGWLIENGHRVFVEVSPRPILGSYLRDTLRQAGQRGAIIETLDETSETGSDPLERSVARVAIAGGTVDRQRLFGPPPVQTIPLPGYPWRHRAYQVQPTAEAQGVFQAPDNPLLGTRPRQDAWQWFSTVDPVLLPWLEDHAVGGMTVFPAAGYVEALLAAGRAIHGPGALEVRELDIVRPLAFDGASSFETQVRVTAESGLAEFLSRPRGAGLDWSLHARGLIARSPTAEEPARVGQEGGRIVVPKAKVYEAAQALGFTYGERFQRVRHVSFPEPKRAVAVLSDASGVTLKGQAIDLTALDAAFHALFAADEAGVADMPMTRMLPVRFGRLRCFAPGAAARYAVARTLRQSPSSILAEFTLCDAEGRTVLIAEAVRLVAAPLAPPLDGRSLVYRQQRWQLARAGTPSTIAFAEADLAAAVAAAAATDLGDALLLVEAGCLRAAWEAFRQERRPSDGRAGTGSSREAPAGAPEPAWPAYLCAALLWQLESKGLISTSRDTAAAAIPAAGDGPDEGDLNGAAAGWEGVPVLAEHCPLPPLGSVVRTLIAHHPTMAAEAAALARVGELLEGLVGGDATVTQTLDASAWRPLEAASRQLALLRQVAVSAAIPMLARAPRAQRLRLLAIGADHAVAVVDMVAALPHVDATLTDPDADRLEQAQALLGDGARVRCMAWATLEGGEATFDAALAIDALAVLAASADGLSRLRALLRPRAPLLAAEPAPGLFWDIVRGMRPGWWSRSAHADFPLGPLLTAPEWIDELATAGFACAGSSEIAAGREEAAGDGANGAAAGAAHNEAAGAAGERVGLLLHAMVSDSPAATGATDLAPARLRWEGARSEISRSLQQQTCACDPQQPEVRPCPTDAEAGQAVAWVVEVGDVEVGSDGVGSNGVGCTVGEDQASRLTDVLAHLAQRCAALAASDTPLRVVITRKTATGRATTGSAVTAGTLPLDSEPLWCAVTAALRVAQNEHPSLDMRCLGVADATPATLAAAALELTSPDAEREILIEEGRRYVFRVEPGAPAPAVFDPGTQNVAAAPAATGHPMGGNPMGGTPTGGAPAEAWHLSPRSATGRGALSWTRRPRTKPGPQAVEIAVAATGLNFRDVMWSLGLLPEEALEDGYAGPQLGMECAGTVSAVGAGVDGLAVGDPVVAFVSGGFASHVIAPAFAVSRIPAGLDAAAAASLPVAYLTAAYALGHLAGLKRDETVLVHGGAGAVGLAALGVARRAGARVIVTAGNAEKRALLRQLGATAALNSRSLAFADEVMALTGGKGVDVVLNSLSGEAMIRSMDCLRPFGRFIELGKRDFYGNTQVGLRPFRRNLSYFGVDVDQLIGAHQELTRRLFGEVMAQLASGALPGLPYRVHDGAHVDEAFRLMQRSQHIGKIVVTPPPAPTDAGSLDGRFPVDADGVHVVVGGTSGFGLAAAEWLAGRGARRLVLASRTGRPQPDAEARIERLRGQGIEIAIAPADVADPGQVHALMARAATLGPVKGIVHAAMVLEDGLMAGLDRAAIARVLQPKVAGGLALATAAAGLALDYLLLFSSATTLLGNPGQYNYVAANAFLEGLARQLQAQGLPALAVAWGGIEDTGYLARHMASNASLRKRFASSLVPAQAALDALDLACDGDGALRQATLTIARIDWGMVRRELAVAQAPALAAVLPAAGGRSGSGAAADLETLRGLPIEEATERLAEIVAEEIARVLRLSVKEVDRHRPLAEIGMDSLMMLELRTTVEETLQVELPIMTLANGITPNDVARRIAGLIAGEGQRSLVTGTLAAVSSSHLDEDVQALDPAQREAAAQVVLERARRLEGPL
ncbi:MAG: type I polyketide synthase [Pseudomonadota bacterium]